MPFARELMKKAPVFLCSDLYACGRSLYMDQVPISQKQIEEILRLANKLAYGSISLIFQDGKLIQIEKHEKIRLK